MVKDGPKYVPNPGAAIAREVLDFLVGQEDYGNRETRTGKALERRFGGIGFGWDRDMLRLVLALLFRAGAIKVSHGGETFESYQDPRSRVPLTNNNAFKSALFTPVKQIDRKTLIRAVENYEALTGSTIPDVDRVAISEALKEFAARELETVLPLEAQVKAHHLPVLGPVQEYREALVTIRSGSADDCVNALAGGGASLKQQHERIRKLGECLDDAGLATLRNARLAVEQMAPLLEARGHTDTQHQVEELKARLAAEDFVENLAAIRAAAGAITSAYRKGYERVHADRTAGFQQAIEKIKGRGEWGAVPESMREPALRPLLVRCCPSLELADGALVCRSCRATLNQMESDQAAQDGLLAQVAAHVQKLTTPPEVRVQRVRLAEFFTGALESEVQVKQALGRLQDHLLKLLDEGVKIVLE